MQRKMKNRAKSILAVLLAGTMFFGNIVGGMNVKADTNTEVNAEAENEFVNAAIDSGYRAPSLQNDEIETYGNLARASFIPSSYSSKDLGYVSEVKSQGSLGICWSYAATACMESYAIKHGMADQSIDLSEYQLAYMSYKDTNFKDPLGGTDGDETFLAGSYSLTDAMQNGGNDNIAFKTLSKWAAIVNETADTNVTSTYNIHDLSYNEDDIAYYLTGQYYISMKDTELVKKAIMDYGAVSTMYNADAPYHRWYNTYHYTFDETGVNHAIAIVGWDDNLDKSNFTMTDKEGNTHTPQTNGAWLVKNSWGTWNCDNGYMWLSYCDKSVSNMNAIAYKVVPASTYDHNYQCDGSTIFGGSDCIYMKSTSYANVFEVPADATSNQYLNAVSFATREANKEYSIQVYKNPTSDTDPVSGTPMFADPISGVTSYGGFYTKNLPQSIALAPGDKFSIVLSFDSTTVIEQSVNKQYVGSCSDSVNVIKENQSFFKSSYEDKYYPTSLSGYSAIAINFCIKGYTNDADSTQPQITSITQNDTDGIEISWQNMGEGLTYSLQKSLSPSGNFSNIYIGGNLSFTDTDVEIGKTYYYKVVQGNKSSTICSYMVEVMATDITSVSSGRDFAQITFKGIAGATEYGIYRWEKGQEPEEIGRTSDLSYKDTSSSLKLGKIYYYAVKVYKDNLESVMSQSQTVALKLPKPTNIQIDNSNYQKFIISWDKVDGVTGYKIFDSYEYNASSEPVGVVVGENNCSYIVDVSKYSDGDRVAYDVEPYIENSEISYSEKPSNYIDAIKRYQPIEITSAQLENGTLNVKHAVFSVPGYTSYATYYNVLIAEAENGPYVQQKGWYTNTATSLTTYIVATGNTKAFDTSKTYYIKVQAYTTNNMSKRYAAVQDKPVVIGAVTPEETPVYTPELSALVDQNYMRGDTAYSLSVSISNKQSGMNYAYQWYVTNTANTEGTAINGAVNNNYKPSTAAVGVKYYYCKVTVTSGSNSSAKTNYAKVTVVAQKQCGDNAWASKENGKLYISGSGPLWNSAMWVGDNSFNSVEIQSGITSIGTEMFKGCTSLREVYIPDSVTSFGSGIFSNTSTELTIYCNSKSKAEEYANKNGLKVYILNGITQKDGALKYVVNGQVKTDYTGIVVYAGDWYYVEQGVVNGNYKGLCLYNGTWYYVENGTVNWNYTGLTKYYSTWYYVEKGVLNRNYTGLTKYYSTWYYVEKGVLNWNYTGLTKYYSTWYYVEKGVLNWNYTGLTKYYSTWYYVEKGVLNWSYTGLTKYYNTWYYVEKGVLNWNYTGLTKYYSTWYYVQGGVLNWNYTGYVLFNGSQCYVRNGRLA